MNQCLTSPEVHQWGLFKFFKISGDIRKWIFITGVNDTSDKLFISVNDTGDKFIIGVVDTSKFLKKIEMVLMG